MFISLKSGAGKPINLYVIDNSGFFDYARDMTTQYSITTEVFLEHRGIEADVSGRLAIPSLEVLFDDSKGFADRVRRGLEELEVMAIESIDQILDGEHDPESPGTLHNGMTLDAVVLENGQEIKVSHE